VYLFSTSVLLDRALKEDADDDSSSHDFGRDVAAQADRPPPRGGLRFRGMRTRKMSFIGAT